MSSIFQPEALKELYEIDPDGSDGLIKSLVTDYVNLSSQAVAKIGEAVAKSDYKQIEFEAHSLKSSSNTLGLMQMGSLCWELERLASEQKYVPGTYEELQRILHKSLHEILAFTGVK